MSLCHGHRSKNLPRIALLLTDDSRARRRLRPLRWRERSPRAHKESCSDVRPNVRCDRHWGRAGRVRRSHSRGTARVACRVHRRGTTGRRVQQRPLHPHQSAARERRVCPSRGAPRRVRHQRRERPARSGAGCTSRARGGRQGAKGIAYLFRKHKIELVQGWGRLAGASGSTGAHRVDVSGLARPNAGNPITGISTSDTQAGDHTLEAPHVIIATGSRAKPLPMLKPDGERIWSSNEAVYPSIVPASLAIIRGRSRAR